MITQFISQVKTRGLARTNRYDVVIPFPVSTTTSFRGAAEVATLFCDQATLPGINISTTPHRIFGEVREMPYEKIYDPVTFSFYVDAELKIRTAFDKWMALIVDPFTRTLGYYNEYVRDIDIYVRNVDDSVPYKITLFEAYPKTVNSITLDAGGKEVMKMTVTMQYKYWYSYNIPISQASMSSSLRTVAGSTAPAQDPRNTVTGSGYRYGDFSTMIGGQPFQIYNPFTAPSAGGTTNSSMAFDPPRSTITTINLQQGQLVLA